jgi:sulfoxide reductase heme-binding subunit YedZ
MTAWLLMVPLAVTSTNGMIMRMGAANWKRLHWLIYPAAISGVAHYWIGVKADIRIPLDFAIVLGILLAYRILERQFPFLRRRPRTAQRAAQQPPAATHS